MYTAVTGVGWGSGLVDADAVFVLSVAFMAAGSATDRCGSGGCKRLYGELRGGALCG